VFGQPTDSYLPNTSLCAELDTRFLNTWPASDFVCWDGVVLGQPHTITAWWLWDSITWVTPSKHHISHKLLHQQEKILSSEAAQIFCDHQHWSVKTWPGSVGARGRNLQTSTLPKPYLHLLLWQAAEGEPQQPHEQWEPERPCLPPGCLRELRGGWCHAPAVVRPFPRPVQTAAATREFLL